MNWTFPIILVFLPATFLAQDFAGRVYPVLEKAQCRTCHNDNGVASATRVQFPREGAVAEEVEGFGLRLRAVVQTGQPDASLLFLKPTNRVAHAGGERIKRGSEDEKISFMDSRTRQRGSLYRRSWLRPTPAMARKSWPSGITSVRLSLIRKTPMRLTR